MYVCAPQCTSVFYFYYTWKLLCSILNILEKATASLFPIVLLQEESCVHDRGGGYCVVSFLIQKGKQSARNSRDKIEKIANNIKHHHRQYLLRLRNEYMFFCFLFHAFFAKQGYKLKVYVCAYEHLYIHFCSYYYVVFHIPITNGTGDCVWNVVY